MTAQAISKYERDEAAPSSGVLIALAEALGVSVDYLVGDRGMVLEAVEFRRNKLTSRREEARVEAKVLHLLERYLTVEELLDLPSIAWDRPREAPWPVLRDPAEAEHAAQGLRTHWGLGLDRESGRPVGGARHQGHLDGPHECRRPDGQGPP